MRKVVRLFLFLLIFILFYFLSINEEYQSRQKITQPKVSVSQEATVTKEIQEAELPIPTITEPDTKIQEPQETFEVKSKSYYYQGYTLTVTEYETFTVVTYPSIVAESDILDFFSFELERYPFLENNCFYELKENSVVLTYPENIVALDYADTLAQEILLYIDSLNTLPAVEEEQIPEPEEPLEIEYSEPEYQKLENAEFSFYSDTLVEPTIWNSFEVKLPENKPETIQPVIEEEPKEEQTGKKPKSKKARFYGESGITAGVGIQLAKPVENLIVSPSVYTKAGIGINKIALYLKVQGAFNKAINHNRLFIELPENIDIVAGPGFLYRFGSFSLSLDVDCCFKNVRLTEIDLFSMVGLTLKPAYLIKLSDKVKLSIGLPLQVITNKSIHQATVGLCVGVTY